MMTPEMGSALLLLVLLGASSTVGFVIAPLLSARHRAQESIDFVRLVVGMLVTFAALLLGLLTTSVKATFDGDVHDRGQYASQLIQLDQCLRNYGSGTEAARTSLQQYTAGVIASTWPDEPAPPGLAIPDLRDIPRTGESVELGRILNRVDIAIRHLTPENAFQATIAHDCGELFKAAMQQRWTLIEEDNSSISNPFYNVLVVWLVIVFASFGLYAPRNSMVILAVALCAISLSLAIFVILDLDAPYGGMFGISSNSMRNALAHMQQ